jgi:hypothetical protein
MHKSGVDNWVIHLMRAFFNMSFDQTDLGRQFEYSRAPHKRAYMACHFRGVPKQAVEITWSTSADVFSIQR